VFASLLGDFTLSYSFRWLTLPPCQLPPRHVPLEGLFISTNYWLCFNRASRFASTFQILKVKLRGRLQLEKGSLLMEVIATTVPGFIGWKKSQEYFVCSSHTLPAHPSAARGSTLLAYCGGPGWPRASTEVRNRASQSMVGCNLFCWSLFSILNFFKFWYWYHVGAQSV
jgi:hypothetical protein